MRRTGLLLAASLVLACAAAHPPGVIYTKVATASMPSPPEALVLTPPSYDRAPQRRYPVLYFLHDGYGDATTLERRGVAADARAAMANGSLREFLIVAPDGTGTWFSDSYDGRRRYEELLAGDLPRWVAARYRVLDAKASRGVTGISMGGFGAIKTALRHDELYGSVSAVSGALLPLDPEDLDRYNWFARWTLERVFGRSPEGNSFAANDPWRAVWSRCFEEPPFPVMLRAGTEDLYGLDGVAAQFGRALNEQGVPATVVLEPGRHDWSYWRGAMLEALAWHAERFEYDAP